MPLYITSQRVVLGGRAYRDDKRYHAVLAVKVCALAVRALAACGRLRALTAALRLGAPVSGNRTRHAGVHHVHVFDIDLWR